jgi:hypothetical protein
VRFSYRAYEVDGTPASAVEDGRIYRPVVPFSLMGPAGIVDFFGLLDTGADESYITRGMAERLGLAIEDRSKYVIESAGGEVAVSYGALTIEIAEGSEQYRWPITIGITDQDWSEAILGHSGFLEFFDVLFRGSDREIVLTRNSKALAALAGGA